MKTLKTIYLIDDDPIAIFVGQKMLAENQNCCQLKTFLGAKLALDCLNDFIKNGQNLPNLILLDLNMPSINGWDFLNILNQNEVLSAIPVAILSSSFDTRDIAEAEKYTNVVEYLTKPLERSKVECVWNLVEKKTKIEFI